MLESTGMSGKHFNCAVGKMDVPAFSVHTGYEKVLPVIKFINLH